MELHVFCCCACVSAHYKPEQASVGLSFIGSARAGAHDDSISAVELAALVTFQSLFCSLSCKQSRRDFPLPVLPPLTANNWSTRWRGTETRFNQNTRARDKETTL